jgi:hypothetical protein
MPLTDTPAPATAEALAALVQARHAAPARLSASLAAALRPLCVAFHAGFGALLALDGEAVTACALLLDGEAREGGDELLTPLLTQGIAGYAAARGGAILLRDIAADPRWGPPSLDAGLPTRGAALALADGDPPRLVLVLAAPDSAPFSAAAVAWLEHALRGEIDAPG